MIAVCNFIFNQRITRMRFKFYNSTWSEIFSYSSFVIQEFLVIPKKETAFLKNSFNDDFVVILQNFFFFTQFNISSIISFIRKESLYRFSKQFIVNNKRWIQSIEKPFPFFFIKSTVIIFLLFVGCKRLIYFFL